MGNVINRELDELELCDLEDQREAEAQEQVKYAKSRRILEQIGIPPESEEGEALKVYGACFITAEERIPRPQFAFSFQDIKFSSFGDIHEIIAPSKTGKTFLATALTCAALKGEYLGVKCNQESFSVLYIDTEQNPGNTQEIMFRVHYICGWPLDKSNPRFRIMSLRTLSPEKRKEAASIAIKSLRPNIVILDGSRDLLNDFNDLKESRALIEDLMALSTTGGCALWHIHHLPPSMPDKETGRGHLGTESDNKRCDKFILSKKGTFPNAYFEATHSSRNNEFGKITFRIESAFLNDGEKIAIPVPYDGNTPPREEAEKMDLYEKFAKIWDANGGVLKTGEITLRLINMNSISKSSAEKWIKKATENGILKKISIGKLRLIHPDTKPEQAEPLPPVAITDRMEQAQAAPTSTCSHQQPDGAEQAELLPPSQNQEDVFTQRSGECPF